MDLSTTPFLPKAEPGVLETNDEEHPEENFRALPVEHARQLWKRRICAATRIITIFLAIWGSISVCFQLAQLLRPYPATRDVYRPMTLEPDLNLCDCGSSIHEALLRGCVYDSLSTAWLPPYCRDSEVTAEFDRAGPGPNGSWPYFADEDGKIAINKSQVAALGETEGVFWSTREWHIAHCLFYWQKYMRMRDTGAVMERRFDSIEHVKHCRRLAMNKMPDHKLLIKVPVLMNSRVID